MIDHICLNIRVTGIVQGVGFRPFVYNLANRYGIKGYVLNDSLGVLINAFGDKEKINNFVENIKMDPPKLSVITSISIDPLEINHKDYPISFIIKESTLNSEKSALVSPDVTICDNCIKELFDKEDRRYHYPFINCTDCGPRYTIISDIPYDRENTSMKKFQMCPNCLSEYLNPNIRRFHAQPNACFLCGPQLKLLTSKGDILLEASICPNEISDINLIECRRSISDKIIRTAISILKEGGIIALKGLGGFHLAVDAENDEAIQRLRKRKNHYEKPLAVMSNNFDNIIDFAYITQEDKLLLDSIQKPIVLIKKKFNKILSENISLRNNCIGVMLPYTPLHRLLLKESFTALVMTSGNLSEEPICIDNQEAFERLKDIADYFIIHNRDINVRCDDSVIRNIYSYTKMNNDVDHEENIFLSKNIIRRARGYVPTPVFLEEEIPSVLAVGAELKNTFCLTKENRAFLSQHIGDLENLITLDYFINTIDHLKNILQIEPDVIAHDLHPVFLNTKWVLENENFKDKMIISVQHHHAHIASCMAENLLIDRVIGFSMDGTGLGLDGNIWGGEILLADYNNFERYSHFEYLPLPGGDAAIREPWRTGVGFLYHSFGEQLFELEIPFLENIHKDKILTIVQMIKNNINLYFTSSLGRLFDVISTIVTLQKRAGYEGQVAIEFENLIYNSRITISDSFYDLYLDSQNVIKTNNLAKEVILDIQNGIAPEIISYKFHFGIVKILTSIAIKIRKERKLNKVVLSGGCFQNNFLLSNLIYILKQNDFEVFTHRFCPTNDGGISLGQAIIAGMRAKNVSNY